MGGTVSTEASAVPSHRPVLSVVGTLVSVLGSDPSESIQLLQLLNLNSHMP